MDLITLFRNSDLRHLICRFLDICDVLQLRASCASLNRFLAVSKKDVFVLCFFKNGGPPPHFLSVRGVFESEIKASKALDISIGKCFAKNPFFWIGEPSTRWRYIHKSNGGFFAGREDEEFWLQVIRCECTVISGFVQGCTVKLAGKVSAFGTEIQCIRCVAWREPKNATSKEKFVKLERQGEAQSFYVAQMSMLFTWSKWK